MINKFVGLNSRILLQDDTVQKQAFDQFDQSYKNFWPFVDFNMKFDGNIIKDVNTYNHTFIQKLKPAYSMIATQTCSGVQRHIKKQEKKQIS